MDTNTFKLKLEEEKKNLEGTLSEIAGVDPNDPVDWKTKSEKLNVMISDRNELADIFEESANKEAIEMEIEDQLNRVKTALQKIEDGTYGICKEGCKIEEKRLEANPTAETCIKHSKDK